MQNFIPVQEPQYQYNQVPVQPKNSKIWPIIVVIVVVCLLGAGFLFRENIYFLNANISDALPTQGYQAIFLTSGQVYFGKLARSGDWLMVSDVYYLQVDQNLQQGAVPNSSNFQLVKLGSEIHGPEDVMYLEPGNVLFWENLKPDSQVLQAIDRYKSGRN